ncbi:MAG: urease accessory protein UreD [Caulobacter sp.]|nr:urease accessory protein UreD [Vitreoscilla sp.]
MAWHARLNLDYCPDAATAGTRLDFRHDGPLRVLTSRSPEGPEVCHTVVVHPPGGIVGGDTLTIDLALADGAHALVTTPGATRFYRSAGARAAQSIDARVAAGGRLEWLPLETLVHSGAHADNRMRFDLAPGAEMFGWDCVALGLPAADAPFVAGDYRHASAVGPRWLERGRTSAADTALLDGPCGWAGHRALGTLWFAAGTPLDDARREQLLDVAREIAGAHALSATAGATAPQPDVVALRVLAPRVEPIHDLLASVWRAWRPLAWGREACVPRVWRT